MSSRTEVVFGSVSAQRHFAQNVALRKNSRHTEFGVDHGHRSHMVVEHFVDGVGHAGIQRHRRNFPVTKFQHAHKNLLRQPHRRHRSKYESIPD
jgi:hypothetical protein